MIQVYTIVDKAQQSYVTNWQECSKDHYINNVVPLIGKAFVLNTEFITQENATLMRLILRPIDTCVFATV